MEVAEWQSGRLSWVGGGSGAPRLLLVLQTEGGGEAARGPGVARWLVGPLSWGLEMPVSSGVEWIGLDGTRLWVPPGQGAGRAHNKFSWACPCPSMDGWSDGRVRGCSVSFFLPANPPSTRDPTQNNFAISTANLAIASLSSAPAHSLARSLARRRPFTRARISQTCFHARPRRRGSPSSSSPSIYPNSSHRHSLPPATMGADM